MKNNIIRTRNSKQPDTISENDLASLNRTGEVEAVYTDKYITSDSFKAIKQFNEKSKDCKIIYLFGDNQIDYDNAKNNPDEVRKFTGSQASAFKGLKGSEYSDHVHGITTVMKAERGKSIVNFFCELLSPIFPSLKQYIKPISTVQEAAENSLTDLRNKIEQTIKEGKKPILLLPATFDQYDKLDTIAIGTGQAAKHLTTEQQAKLQTTIATYISKTIPETFSSKPSSEYPNLAHENHVQKLMAEKNIPVEKQH